MRRRWIFVKIRSTTIDKTFKKLLTNGAHSTMPSFHTSLLLFPPATQRMKSSSYPLLTAQTNATHLISTPSPSSSMKSGSDRYMTQLMTLELPFISTTRAPEKRRLKYSDSDLQLVPGPFLTLSRMTFVSVQKVTSCRTPPSFHLASIRTRSSG